MPVAKPTAKATKKIKEAESTVDESVPEVEDKPKTNGASTSAAKKPETNGKTEQEEEPQKESSETEAVAAEPEKKPAGRGRKRKL